GGGPGRGPRGSDPDVDGVRGARRGHRLRLPRGGPGHAVAPSGDPRREDRQLPSVPAHTVERESARRARHAGPLRRRRPGHAPLRGESPGTLQGHRRHAHDPQLRSVSPVRCASVRAGPGDACRAFARARGHGMRTPLRAAPLPEPAGLSDPTDRPIERVEDAEAILSTMAQAFSSVLPSPHPGGDREGRPARIGAPAGDEQARHRWTAEARYRSLVEQIPAVTFLAALDEDLREFYVSPQIEALLGFTQEEWLSNPFLWYRQLHPDDRERCHLEFARGCRTGGPFRAEFRALTRDGRVVWVRGEARVVRDERGTPLFIQGIGYDITESKRAEEAVRASAEQIEASLREKEVLLEEIHHRV